MRKLLLFICPVFFLNFIVQAQNVSQVEKSDIIENIDGKDYYLHFVKEGETLFAVAHAYGVTVNDIFATNPESTKGIKPGQILKIRVKQKTKEISTSDDKDKYIYHIVKKKETLYSISRKYGVSIDEIEAINKDRGDFLREGQTLKIPHQKQEEAPGLDIENSSKVLHVVKQGETLYGIAKEYGITIGEIKIANPGISNTLSIGQELIIPNQDKQLQVEEELPSEKKEPEIEEYIVKQEETIYIVARKNAVSLDTLKKYNPGLNEAVYVGQEIKLPKERIYQDFIIHRVTNRDKLVRIARLYDVDYNLLLVMNPELSKRVKNGDRVKIPVELQKPKKTVDDPDEDDLIIEHPEPDCIERSKYTDQVFNVALMLPLHLEEIDSLYAQEITDFGKISALPAFRFIQFYEGFKMAVDSIQKKGMNLNLFVYDVDNTPEKVDKVLAASELSSMDLIIGPVFNKDFSRIARFAKTLEINIVNPFSSRQEILQNNAYVFKVKPGMNHQIDHLLNYIIDNYPRENIVVVRNNKYKYQPEISYIKNYLNSQRNLRVFLPNTEISRTIEGIEKDNRDGLGMENFFTENKLLNKDQIKKNQNDSTYFSNIVKEVIYVNDSATGLELNLSKVRNNIVIALADEKVFAQELLSKLNKLRLNHEIVLFGIPEWESFDHLETMHLLNLRFHSFSVGYVDYHNQRTRKWINDFRKKYHTEPSINRYAFQGFDIGWYFLNVLYMYGKDFENCLNDYDIEIMHTEFNFEKTTGNGFENTYWILGKYMNYRYVPVN